MHRITLYLFLMSLLFSCSQAEKESDYLLHLVFDNNQGLTDKSKIYDNDGNETGTVLCIGSFDSKALVTVRFDNKVAIPIDSEFSVFTASLLGDKSIEVNYGHSLKVFTNNDTIYEQAEKSIFQSIENKLNNTDNQQIDSIELERIKAMIDTIYSTTHKLIDHISNQR